MQVIVIQAKVKTGRTDMGRTNNSHVKAAGPINITKSPML